MSLPSYHTQSPDNLSIHTQRIPLSKRFKSANMSSLTLQPQTKNDLNGYLYPTPHSSNTSDSVSTSGSGRDSDSESEYVPDGSSRSSYLSSRKYRKAKSTALTQIICTALFLGICGYFVHSKSNTATMTTAFDESMSWGRSKRQMLVIPYCGLSNRLTLMIESLSLSLASQRTPVLNWIVDEERTGEFNDIFDEERSPFNTVYVNADLPESIDPSKLQVDGTLVLEGKDIPRLNSRSRGVDVQGSFIERNIASLAKRTWNRKHQVNGVGRTSGQGGRGEGVIVAGCREGGLDDPFVALGSGGGSVVEVGEHSHVEHAMHLFSSVKCGILTEASRFHAILKLNKNENKLGMVVGVSITASNSPFNKEGSWASTEAELMLYEGGSVLYVASDDDVIIKWFCGKYRHVVAVGKEGGDGGGTEGKLLDLLNLGNTDYVIGDREDSFSRLAKWLSNERIVRNVLKQQRMTECVKKVGTEVFMEHDFAQCSFEHGLQHKR